MSRNQKEDLSTPFNSSEFKTQRNIWEIQPSVERLVKIRGISRDENIDFSSVTCEPSTRRKRRMSPIFEVPGDNAENKVNVFFDRMAEVCKKAGKTDKNKILQSLKFLFFDDLDLEKKTRDSIQRIWLEMGNSSLHETFKLSSVNSTPKTRKTDPLKKKKTAVVLGEIENPGEQQRDVSINATPAGSSSQKENKIKNCKLRKKVARRFACKYCQKTFSHNSTLNNHILIHTGEKPYKCTKCNTEFTQQGQLYYHLLKHSGVKPHKCSKCDKQFTTKGNLKSHLWTHSGVKPHKCSKCDKQFTTKGTLKSHLWTHSGAKPHKCTKCDKQFTRKGNLKSHLWTHCEVKPHKCKECNKMFTQVRSLKKHSIVHLDEKGQQKMRKLWKHGCYFCHKKFITPSMRNDHLMTHTGEKPHKCPRCNLRFTQKINMRTHEKSKHLAV